MNRMPHPRKKSRWVQAWIFMVSCALGILLSVIPHTPSTASTNVTTTDRVPPQYQVGETIYQQSCGQCHFAIPPAVFPTQTWEQILRDSSHYGASIQVPAEPQLSWMRRYLRFSSRLLNEGESTPYRFQQSRYFKILHPKMDIAKPITFDSCKTCHAKATDFNFRE